MENDGTRRLNTVQKSKSRMYVGGGAVWQTDGGSVDCHFVAQITLKPAMCIEADKELAGMLKYNPFVTTKAITEYFEKQLRKYLDDEFEEYCICDEYY